MKHTKIFISHSSENKPIVDFLCAFLLDIGIPSDEVFSSSTVGQGVSEKIPDEIKAALRSSIVDIIVLSPEYQKSDYCLNEAGIIWFKNKSAKIVIATPDLSHNERAGFINGSNFLFHNLTDRNILVALLDRISEKLPGLHARKLVHLSSQLEQLIKKLPATKNLPAKTIHGMDILTSKQTVRKCVETYAKHFNNPNVFYHRFSRCISISAANRDGYIRVNTGTKMAVVNLSNSEHIEAFNPQFLKNNGGVDTYVITDIIQDGERLTDTQTQTLNQLLDFETFGMNSSYISGTPVKVVVMPHCTSDIWIQTVYEIPIDMFFQAKIICLPCTEYTLNARFDNTFKQAFGESYVFRYQIFPPDPYNFTATNVSSTVNNGDPDKQVVSISFRNGVRPGTGYALAISKISI